MAGLHLAARRNAKLDHGRRRLKHAATKDQRASGRAAACVRCSPPVHAHVRPERSLHCRSVFSAECIPAFDWQSVGLFYSFYHSKQPGRITRLLACEDEQLRVRAPSKAGLRPHLRLHTCAEPAARPGQVYPKVNLEMGPTFVHKNMRYDKMNEAEKFDQYHDGKCRGCRTHAAHAAHAARPTRHFFDTACVLRTSG